VRLLLIMNPVAGRRSPDHVEAAVRDSFGRRGITATIDTAFPRTSGDATATARDAAERYDIIVAVGGDGTVRDVAAGLSGSTTPLAIIPNGTANVLASDLGIPVRTTDAADLLREGAYTVPLDLGDVNGEPFVLNVGAGYAARLILGTPHSWKRRVGFFAYLPAAVRATFANDRARTTVVVDGKRYEGRVQMIFVANSGGIGGRAIQIAEGVRYDDGLFTVAMFAPRSPIGTLIAFTQIAARRWSRITGVRYWEGAEISVTCDPPLPIQVDGDGMGRTPFTIKMHPAALRVIVQEPSA
jgi:diacylglycerol kinase (ATP)